MIAIEYTQYARVKNVKRMTFRATYRHTIYDKSFGSSKL